jgi:hypothetical protein
MIPPLRPETSPDDWLKDRPSLLSRRTVLKAAGVGGLLLGGGTLFYEAVWKPSPPGPGRVCLSEYEFEVCQKLGETFFPGMPVSPLTAAEVQLAEFADSYIGGMYEKEQRLFKLLLKAFNLQPIFTQGRTFVGLPLEQRQMVLNDWAESKMSARKAGYQSLRFVLSMGYFEDLRVRKALGLRFGCPLPERADVSGNQTLERRWG